MSNTNKVTAQAASSASSDAIHKTITMAELSQMFGVSLRTVQRLSQVGIFKSVGTENRSKVFDLSEATQAYCQHLENKAAAKDAESKTEKLKEQKIKADIALKESQGELHRLKTDIASNKYISIDDVKLDYQRFFVVFKKFAMAIPNRIGGITASYVDPVTARALEKDLQKEFLLLLQSFNVAGIKPSALSQLDK